MPSQERKGNDKSLKLLIYRFDYETAKLLMLWTIVYIYFIVIQTNQTNKQK